MILRTSTEIRQLIRRMLDRCDLTEHEAEQAFDDMLLGRLGDAEIASFLVALAMKGESPAEIRAAVRSIKKHSRTISPKSAGKIIDTCGTGGDSKSTFNISTVAGIVASAAGATIAKHGNRSSSGVCGSADFMEAVGFALDSPPSGVQKSIEEIGLGFLFAPMFHPLMRNVSSARKAMGVRSVFNIAGPLCNPCENLSGQVIGVYSESLAARLVEALGEHGANVMIVSGSDGLDELSTTCSSKVTWIRNSGKESTVVSPGELGMKETGITDLQVASKEESVTETLKVIYGIGSRQKEDVVVLNAAAALLVSATCASFEEGVKRSREAISTGAARRQLTGLVERCGDLKKLGTAEKDYLGL
ncbi:MAG: anthranilate phosphoribosyltransferase [Nitrososphaera sp.]